jgi:hypothetical protein
MNKEAFAYALRGYGLDDLVAKFGIARADAKALVWAAYEQRRGKGPKFISFGHAGAGELGRATTTREGGASDGVPSGRR